MVQIFLIILNMSLAGSLTVLATLVARWLIKSAPKRYACIAWAVPFVRFLWPWGALSLDDILQLPENAVQIAGLLWIFGVVAVALYAALSYRRALSNIAGAVEFEDGIYHSDHLPGPAVVGFRQPKIFIPFGLMGDARQYLIAKQRCHVKHRHQIVKLLAFCVLAVHWFNPLCHVAFALLLRDLQMRCDEELASEGEAYADALNALWADKKAGVKCPLILGETGIRSRVKRIRGWKAPRRWRNVMAAVMCALLILGCAAGGIDYEALFRPAPNIPTDVVIPDGAAYVSDACVYQSLALSVIHADDSGFIYMLGGGSFTMTSKVTGSWQYFAVPEKGWEPFAPRVDHGLQEWLRYLELDDLISDSAVFWQLDGSSFLVMAEDSLYYGEGSADVLTIASLLLIYRLRPAQKDEVPQGGIYLPLQNGTYRLGDVIWSVAALLSSPTPKSQIDHVTVSDQTARYSDPNSADRELQIDLTTTPWIHYPEYNYWDIPSLVQGMAGMNVLALPDGVHYLMEKDGKLYIGVGDSSATGVTNGPRLQAVYTLELQPQYDKVLQP